jgi:anti-sigma factor RsiW
MAFNIKAYLDHRFATKNLSAYMDDELTDAQQQRVEHHLSVCSSCREELAQLRQTAMILRQAPRHTAPRSFALPRSVQVEQRQHRRWNAAFGAMRTASAVVSLLLVLFLSGDVLISQGVIPAPARGGMVQMAQEKAKEVAVDSAVPERAAPQPTPQPQATSPAEAMVKREQPEAETEVVEKVVPQEEAAIAEKVEVQRTAEVEVAPETAVEAPARMIAPPTGAMPRAASPRTAEGGAYAGQAGPDAETVPKQASPPIEALTVEEAPTAEPDQEVASAKEETVEEVEAPVAKEATVEEEAAEQQPDALAPLHTPSLPPTTEEPLAMLADETVEATEDVARERAVPSVPEARTPVWSIWRALRIGSGVLLGLLLMLVAAMIWVAPKRQV